MKRGPRPKTYRGAGNDARVETTRGDGVAGIALVTGGDAVGDVCKVKLNRVALVRLDDRRREDEAALADVDADSLGRGAGDESSGRDNGVEAHYEGVCSCICVWLIKTVNKNTDIVL